MESFDRDNRDLFRVSLHRGHRARSVERVAAQAVDVMADVLRVDSMSKRFGERRALAGVNFSLHPGEFVGLLGPSGAGKSTLFRCIAGLELADSGNALLGEQVLSPLHGHGAGRIAMVFQQFALVDRLQCGIRDEGQARHARVHAVAA